MGLRELAYTIKKELESRLNGKYNILICIVIIGFLLIASLIYFVEATRSPKVVQTEHSKLIVPDNYTVVANHKSKVYHKPDCHHSKRCTKNCETVKFSEIAGKGYRPCKVCFKKH